MQGIWILEVVHKLISTIINVRMEKAIRYCPAVHGFCRQRGCYTAVEEAKLRMQEAACKGVTLYQV